jgi:hypothetical protein
MMNFLTYIMGFFYELAHHYAYTVQIWAHWPFEEISIFSNSSHLGYRTALTDTILKGDHPRIIQTKFG